MSPRHDTLPGAVQANKDLWLVHKMEPARYGSARGRIDKLHVRSSGRWRSCSPRIGRCDPRGHPHVRAL